MVRFVSEGFSLSEVLSVMGLFPVCDGVRTHWEVFVSGSTPRLSDCSDGSVVSGVVFASAVLRMLGELVVDCSDIDSNAGMFWSAASSWFVLLMFRATQSLVNVSHSADSHCKRDSAISGKCIKYYNFSFF